MLCRAQSGIVVVDVKPRVHTDGVIFGRDQAGEGSAALGFKIGGEAVIAPCLAQLAVAPALSPWPSAPSAKWPLTVCGGWSGRTGSPLRFDALFPSHALGAAAQQGDARPARIGGHEINVAREIRRAAVAAQDHPFDKLARQRIGNRALDIGRIVGAVLATRSIACLTAVISNGAVEAVGATAIGSTGACGMAGRSARLPGRAETGTAGVEPVAKEPRIGGARLMGARLSVTSLVAAAALVLTLVFSVTLAPGLSPGLLLNLLPELAAEAELVLASFLAASAFLSAFSSLLSLAFSAILSVLAAAFVSALALGLEFLLPGRAAGIGTGAVVDAFDVPLVGVCADTPVMSAPHARMPQAASTSESRIPCTFPPARGVRPTSSSSGKIEKSLTAELSRDNLQFYGKSGAGAAQKLGQN